MSGRLSMKNVEDGRLCFFFNKILRLKRGIITDVKCLHACGPYYSKEFGYLERDIAKYRNSNLGNIANVYESYKEIDS